MKKFIFLSLMLFSSLSAVTPSRMYIDEDEFTSQGDAFHIHMGGNVWIMTNTLHRDRSGIFTYEDSLNLVNQGTFQKQWKCPYCFQYWDIGRPCGNKDCPSKYK